MNHFLLVLSILALNIAVSEWLVRNSFLRHFGTALLVILITAVEANLGIIPSASDKFPLYGDIFEYIAPMALFYLLLGVSFRSLRQAGGPMISIFFIGSLGTILGVAAATFLVDLSSKVELAPALSGMFAGTYTGGSINFNAIALHYEVMKEGNLYAGSVAVDNILTAIWMIATIAIPKMMAGGKNATLNIEENGVMDQQDSEVVNPSGIAILLILAPAVIWSSNSLSEIISVPSILIVTTIALCLAQFSAVQEIGGSRSFGLIGVYLFLAVIGAYCDLESLGKIGELAIVLLAFASIIVAIHGLVTFSLGVWLFKDWDLAAVASQANVGGSTSALALAKSVGRQDLILPGILVGALGNGVGTYLGFLMVALLGG
ncbi:MAG: DUF819 family protein [Candidatus Neomarinimicrobiota bacterium]|nr:DUF819 family protein [Candidatus Neomarinimicrobiota bacterium]